MSVFEAIIVSVAASIIAAVILDHNKVRDLTRFLTDASHFTVKIIRFLQGLIQKFLK